MDDNLIKVFGPGGATTTIGQKGSGPGEFQRVTRVGFMGDTLWALDPVLMRVNIYGPDFKYVRTFPQPMSATSGAASRPGELLHPGRVAGRGFARDRLPPSDGPEADLGG
ncbi:MAG: hypothetical protein IPP98_10350 [Gemmatimonadetes bacterium]|nr:hypothetical protein [Gemmatimonadota bacterium]